MNLDELRLGKILALGLQIHDLSSDQTPGVRAERKLGHVVASSVSFALWSLSDDREGFGQDRIAREDRHSLSVSDMSRGLAPAQIVVIHAGKIVMHKGIGMDQFHGAGRGKRLFDYTAAGFCRGETKDGPQAFATSKYGMAHCAVNGGRTDTGLRQKSAQRCINGTLSLLEVGLEIGH